MLQRDNHRTQGEYALMNLESYAYQPPPPAPSRRPVIRWTLADLLLVGALAIALGAALVLLLRVPGLAGALGLRDQTLIVGMILGGLVYGLFVVATYLVIVRRGRGSWREIGFRAPPLLPVLLLPLMFVGQMATLVTINLILRAFIGEFENPQVAALTDPGGFSWSNFAAVFLVGAVIAPIVEELIFRGLIYQWLRARSNVVVAVLVSAAIFSGAHVIPVLLPALFGVGVVLALAYEWSRSLWVTIALHFFQNALAISVFFFVQANPQLLPQT